jgi:hypothetical protein
VLNSESFYLYSWGACWETVYFVIVFMSYVQYRCIQITWYLSVVILYTVVVRMMQPLLGLCQNSQERLYLCQKHGLSQCNGGSHYQTTRMVDRARETAHQALLHSVVQMELKSSVSYTAVFLKWRENVRTCVCCVTPPPPSQTGLPLHPCAKRVWVIWQGQYFIYDCHQSHKINIFSFLICFKIGSGTGKL